MIQSFEYYERKGLVKSTKINPDIAKSLMEKAETRLNKIARNNLLDKESSINFEEIYEALRESSQSIMQLRGFKPYSHEVVIAFLKKHNVLPIEDINILDKYRILRNKSVYEAEEISLDKCKEALVFAKRIVPKVKAMFKTISKV